jgi:hypothetical protein
VLCPLCQHLAEHSFVTPVDIRHACEDADNATHPAAAPLACWHYAITARAACTCVPYSCSGRCCLHTFSASLLRTNVASRVLIAGEYGPLLSIAHLTPFSMRASAVPGAAVTGGAGAGGAVEWPDAAAWKMLCEVGCVDCCGVRHCVDADVLLFPAVGCGIKCSLLGICNQHVAALARRTTPQCVTSGVGSCTAHFGLAVSASNHMGYGSWVARRTTLNLACFSLTACPMLTL